MLRMKNIWLVILLLGLLPPVTAQAQQQTKLAKKTDAGWTVNIRNADIQAFIKQVADMTGKNFVVDPRVRAKDVTVISNQPLTSKQVYQLFLAVLDVHGYAAVPGDGVIKIVPNTTAKQSNLPLEQGKTKGGEQLITRVIPVENSPVQELVPVLRPLVPQYGHLAAVASANALIISDHADNVRRIQAIIQQLDQSDNQQIEVIELKHAWAGDLVKLLENLTPTASQGGAHRQGQQGGQLTLVADERTNRLIIKGDQAARERVRQLVEELDIPQSSNSGVKVVRLANADAKKTAELLTNFVKSETSGKGPKSGPANETSIQADESTNSLVIRAQPAVMKELRSVISQLDVERAQILIEAAIVEVSGDHGLDLGFQYAAGNEKKGVAAINFSNVGISVNDIINSITQGKPTTTLADGITAGGGQNDSNGNFKWGGFVQALASSSNVNLLSTPSILTLDNQEASIIVGENVPFVTGQSTNTGAGVSNPFQTIQRQDVGLTLKVTPHIAGDKEVRLELKQETSNVKPDSQAVDIVTTKRAIDTTVLAQDRQTIVLGGLISDNIRKTVHKVPLLGDIPILGYLFRSTSQSHQKQNLMVFLRPTILTNSQRLVNLTRGKYLGITALQFRVNDRGELERTVSKPLPAEPDELFEGREGTPDTMKQYLKDHQKQQQQTEQKARKQETPTGKGDQADDKPQAPAAGTGDQ